MPSPEQSEQSKQFAADFVTNTVEAASIQDYDTAATAELLKFVVDEATRAIGKLATVGAEVIPVEVSYSTVYERLSDEELEPLYKNLADALTAKRRKNGYEQGRPKRIPLHPRYQQDATASVDTATSSVGVPLVAPPETGPINLSDPMHQILSPLAELPNMDLYPVTDLDIISTKERLQSYLMDPDIRARAISQLETEAGRGPVGRFTRVVSDKLGVDQVGDDIIKEVTVRIEDAMAEAQAIYEELGENYQVATKSKRVLDLMDKYAAVRDLTRYWLRQTYDLPVPSLVIVDSATNRPRGGSIKPPKKVHLGEEEMEFVDNQQLLDGIFLDGIGKAKGEVRA